MFQRRAKEKAEAALQNSFTEEPKEQNSPTPDCPAPEEMETKREQNESLNEKSDQSDEMLDTSQSLPPVSTADPPVEGEESLKVFQDNIESDETKMGHLLQEKEDAPQPESQEETATPTRASVIPFNTPDYRFECICGELGIIDYKARVQCMNCQLWQHAECVNYKEESLETTPFYCPHCLVAMKPVSTGATLIISPSSICHQWVGEINRHISSSSLRVLVGAQIDICQCV